MILTVHKFILLSGLVVFGQVVFGPNPNKCDEPPKSYDLINGNEAYLLMTGIASFDRWLYGQTSESVACCLNVVKNRLDLNSDPDEVIRAAKLKAKELESIQNFLNEARKKGYLGEAFTKKSQVLEKMTQWLPNDMTKWSKQAEIIQAEKELVLYPNFKLIVELLEQLVNVEDCLSDTFVGAFNWITFASIKLDQNERVKTLVSKLVQRFARKCELKFIEKFPDEINMDSVDNPRYQKFRQYFQVDLQKQSKRFEFCLLDAAKSNYLNTKSSKRCKYEHKQMRQDMVEMFKDDPDRKYDFMTIPEYSAMSGENLDRYKNFELMFKKYVEDAYNWKLSKQFNDHKWRQRFLRFISSVDHFMPDISDGFSKRLPKDAVDYLNQWLKSGLVTYNIHLLYEYLD